MKMSEFFSAWLAGLLIGLSVFVRLMQPNEFGIILFSMGMTAILILNLDLFTGKIGYIFKDNRSIKYYLGIFLSNWIGALSAYAVAANPIIKDKIFIQAALIAENRPDNIITIFFSSIMCGILVYIAVYCYKKTKSILSIMLPIVVLVGSGFHHVVAEMFYLSLIMSNFFKYCFMLLVIGLGNSIGSMITSIIVQGKEKRGV